MKDRSDERGVTPVIGSILVVAVVVVLAATVGVSMLQFGDKLSETTGKPMAYGDNLIENPSFESGADHWTLYSEGRIVTAGGSNALEVRNEGGAGYTDQYLDAVLENESEYRLCATSRLEQQSGGGQAYIGVQHDTGGEDIQLTVWEVTWSEFRDRCDYFTTDGELTDITVWVYTSADGTVRVTADEFVLQRTRYITDGV